MSTTLRTDPTGLIPLPAGTFSTPRPGGRTLSVDVRAMAVRSVITTGEPDRAGDVVVPTGVRNVEEFLLNPVVLWAHNRSHFPPIGTCAWLDVQPKRIVAETRFAQGVAFAEDLFRLYEQGVLRGWSIGFVPRRAVRIPAGPGRPAGMRVEEWDLLEYSAVPIPENPGALTVALEKGLVKDLSLRAWLAGSQDAHAITRPPVRVVGDVMGQLFETPNRNPVSALETGFLGDKETRFRSQKPGF